MREHGENPNRETSELLFGEDNVGREMQQTTLFGDEIKRVSKNVSARLNTS